MVITNSMMAIIIITAHPSEEKIAFGLKNTHRSSLCYVIRVFWAFVKSNIFIFSTPRVLFGIASTLSTSKLFNSPYLHLINVFGRLPKVILSNIFTILLFNFANQRSPASVLEDSINKL